MIKIAKFYDIKNQNNAIEMYIYGEIIGGTDKWDESDVTFDDFKNALNGIKNGGVLEMYINSPGGSVFTTQGIMNMITRTKQNKGLKVNAYIDGLAASCASWLPMIADNVFVYNSSMMMVHKPMTSVWIANSNQLKDKIDLLDKLEDDVIVPAYLSKAKNLDETKIKDMMAKETWLNSTEIAELFNVTLLEEEKQFTACADIEILNRYKNTPKDLKDKSISNVQKPAKSKIAEEVKAMEGFENFGKNIMFQKYNF